jgi:hypothetical protein
VHSCISYFLLNGCTRVKPAAVPALNLQHAMYIQQMALAASSHVPHAPGAKKNIIAKPPVVGATPAVSGTMCLEICFSQIFRGRVFYVKNNFLF